MVSPTTDVRFESRLARARQLAASRPEARGPLEFLVQLTTLQQSLAAAHRTAEAAVADCLHWLEVQAPEPIALAARDARGATWQQWLTTYTRPNVNAPTAFIVETLLQTFPADPCTFCSGPPVVSLLREAGHGARRTMVCGACLRESPALRLGCVACGEANLDKLAVFRTESADPARLDACDTCRVYVKTIDLTRDAEACPVADDIASVTLDLWAREHGYRRNCPSLLRL
jgi:FdhE protein